MTREEAAKICQSIKFMMDKDDYSEAVEEALNMAIETLAQEPTAEYSSDVISRQAVLNLAKEGKLLSGNIYKKASDYINELPSADRPTGHWIEDEKQNVLMRKFIEKGEVWRVCSVCGAGLMIGAEYETDKYYHETFHNYCPKCGADMRGEDE